MAGTSPLRQALGNREIRLAELAYMLGVAAEAGYLVALLVNAYELGGIVQVGLAGVARTIPAGLLAPLVAGISDRAPRNRVLLVTELGRATVVGGLAVTAFMGGNAALLLGLAAAEGLIATLMRPSHMSLLPALASAPEELVAANVVSGASENVGSLVGPALGAMLVASLGVPVAFGAAALTFALAALAIAFIHPATQPVLPPNEEGWRRSLDGLRALRAHPSAALVVGLATTQTFVRGLMTVLLVAAAAEILGLGDHGYGYLQAAIGFGGIVGAVTIVALAGSVRLSSITTAGLALWGIPIALIGLVPNGVFALAMLVGLGFGNATFDVGLLSLLQRNVPNRSRASVLGALEGLIMLTVGIGSFLAPFLERFAGIRSALVITGLVLPVLAVLSARAVRRADEGAVVPERQMRLLRGVGMFRPLPLTVVEHLAGCLRPAQFAAGETATVEGEQGDVFFIIGEGSAQVESGGNVVRRLGVGDSFGEIALLRAVPRTATVRADGPMQAFSLARDDFVSAVTGNVLAVGAADTIIGQRLGEDATRA